MADEPSFGGRSNIKPAGAYAVPFQHLQRYRTTGGIYKYRPTGYYYGGISYFTQQVLVRGRYTSWKAGDRLLDLRNEDVYQITTLILSDIDTQCGVNDVRTQETVIEDDAIAGTLDVAMSTTLTLESDED